jgi:transposase
VVLEKATAKLEKRDFACDDDALEAAGKVIAACAPRFHRFEVGLRCEQRRLKRSHAGRPPKDAPIRTKRVWHTFLEIARDRVAFVRELARESCFILATNAPREGPSAQSDSQVFSAYQEQATVEGCMRWAKGPLEVAPVFLKTPRRIAALGLVYVLALMTYSLIQRDARRRLVAAKAKMPGNIGWTDQPTTEVIFRLFEGIFTLHDAATAETTVTNMTTEQVRVLRLLGNEVLDRPNVTFAPPSIPRPGQRGFTRQDRAPRKSSGS